MTHAKVIDLDKEWASSKRWQGITRPYKGDDVLRLRGSVHIEYTLARMGAENLWYLFQTEPFIRTFGALTGNQAVQMARAGLQAIYVSGWQVAADANSASQTYPDQSLYPADSVPNLVRRINRALQRADQIEHSEGKSSRDWFLPIVADAEAGFGGALYAFGFLPGDMGSRITPVLLEDDSGPSPCTRR